MLATVPGGRSFLGCGTVTRPGLVGCLSCTWLPRPVVGENHGDHQAASILATEAFDLAGDPTIFPSQVASALLM